MSRLVFSISFYCFVALMVFSCVNESNDTCHFDYAVRIKAVDQSGEDISPTRVAGTATIYLFDKNGEYLDMISVSEDEIANGKPVKFTLKGVDDVWASVWSNLNGSQNVFMPAKGMNINEILVQLKRDSDNKGVNPDDIFWGIKQIHSEYGLPPVSETEIVISRMTSRMTITVKGLDPQLEGEYSFRIDDAQHDSFTYAGKLTGDPVAYRESGIFNQEGLYSTSEAFSMFPTSDEEIVTVSILKGDQVLASVQADMN